MKDNGIVRLPSSVGVGRCACGSACLAGWSHFERDEGVCVECAQKLLNEEVARRRSCRFCGKSREAVRLLITAPDETAICDECISLCVEIIAEHYPAAVSPEAPHGGTP